MPRSTAVTIELNAELCLPIFLLKNFWNYPLSLQKVVWKFLVACAAENCVFGSHSVTTRTDFQNICFNLNALAAFRTKLGDLLHNIVAVATRGCINGRGRWRSE